MSDPRASDLLRLWLALAALGAGAAAILVVVLLLRETL
jgi:hypothetical protein